jgi:molybdate transport system substrate-binding protein
VIRGAVPGDAGQTPIEDLVGHLHNIAPEGQAMRIAFVSVVAVLLVSSRASATEIAVLATGATKEIVLELIPQFEKSAGHKVVATWTGTAGIRKRIGDGKVYDLVIVGAPVVDSFIAQGKVVPGSRTELMKSAVGVAVRAGAPKPNIGSSEAVKTMLMAAKSIGYSTGPSRGSRNWLSGSQ